MAFLEMKNVGKGFGDKRDRAEILADINLEVEKGEFVAIVGYSGAGKSTLVNMLAGLTSPDSGTITVDGKPVTGPGSDRGMVFQNYSLLPWLTAFENVYLAVDQTFSSWSVEKKREHTTRYLAMVNLGPAHHKKPSELSGGMRQRVAVARALAMESEVLLMDEPLGALDALTRATIQDEIARIWAETHKTIVLITNDVDEGILLADRIIPLSVGPAATLGPAVKVTVPRPRDRKAMNHDAGFKAVRNQVIEYLLGPGKRRPQPGPSSPNTTTSPVAKKVQAAATPVASGGASSDMPPPEGTSGAVSAPREVAA
jgi:nitrate/nitrite transport system ATP-binding protein